MVVIISWRKVHVTNLYNSLEIRITHIVIRNSDVLSLVEGHGHFHTAIGFLSLITDGAPTSHHTPNATG